MTFWENMFVGSLVAGLAADAARNNATDNNEQEDNNASICTENAGRSGVSLGQVMAVVIETAIMAALFVAMLHFVSHFS